MPEPFLVFAVAGGEPVEDVGVGRGDGGLLAAGSSVFAAFADARVAGEGVGEVVTVEVLGRGSAVVSSTVREPARAATTECAHVRLEQQSSNRATASSSGIASNRAVVSCTDPPFVGAFDTVRWACGGGGASATEFGSPRVRRLDDRPTRWLRLERFSGIVPVIGFIPEKVATRMGSQGLKE